MEYCFLIIIFMLIDVWADPCTTYSVLDSEDDFTRSVANSDTAVNTICDNTLPEGWYRVVSKSGERMPTSCVRFGFRCGTINPIWLNGSFPLLNQTMSVTACTADFNGDCCSESNTIQIKNCSTYLVYNLLPVSGCYKAYCFGSELPCKDGQVSENGFSPGCELDPCLSSNHVILHDAHQRSPSNILQPKDTPIEDSRLATRWYRINSSNESDICNTSIPTMRCGTVYPLWMKGSVPEEANTTVRRKVCRSGITSDCDRQYDIKIRNCGDYRVYYLTQLPVDKSAYCFGSMPILSHVEGTTVENTQQDAHDDNTKSSANNDNKYLIPLMVVAAVFFIGFVIILFVLISRTNACSTSSRSHKYEDQSAYENPLSNPSQDNGYQELKKMSTNNEYEEIPADKMINLANLPVIRAHDSQTAVKNPNQSVTVTTNNVYFTIND